MKCTRVEKFLPLYVAGDLDDRRARAIAQHVTTCEGCRRAADDYHASRDLLRAAATLPPDFDGAFYEQIRNSVLAQIGQKRTLAPPPFARFASLFNSRLVYAASLALIIIAATMLSLHGYFNRTARESTPQKIMAHANRQPPATPTATATPETTQATSDHDRPTLIAVDKVAGARTGGGIDEQKSPSPQRRTRNENSRSGTQTGLVLTKHEPSPVRRNPLAPTVAATSQANVAEIAPVGNSGAAVAQAEVSRIEIQTSDPNIRIIWLSPKAENAAQPLQ